jgi:hypothetical protein
VVAVLPILTLLLGTPTATTTQTSGIETDSSSPQSQNPLRSPHPHFLDAGNVELVGHIGGVVEAVAVQEDHAYIGQGYSMLVLDISNPASPSLVGKTLPLPSIVKGVAVSGDYAYIVGGDRYHGLCRGRGGPAGGGRLRPRQPDRGGAL